MAGAVLRAAVMAADARRDAAFAAAARAYRAAGAKSDGYGGLMGGSPRAAAAYQAAITAAWNAHDADPAVAAAAVAEAAGIAAADAKRAADEAAHQASRAAHRETLVAAVDAAVDAAGQFASTSGKVATARRELAIFDAPHGGAEDFDRKNDFIRGSR